MKDAYQQDDLKSAVIRAEMRNEYRAYIDAGIDDQWAVKLLAAKYGMPGEKIRELLKQVRLTNTTPNKN